MVSVIKMSGKKTSKLQQKSGHNESKKDHRQLSKAHQIIFSKLFFFKSINSAHLMDEETNQRNSFLRCIKIFG